MVKKVSYKYEVLVRYERVHRSVAASIELFNSKTYEVLKSWIVDDGFAAAAKAEEIVEEYSAGGTLVKVVYRGSDLLEEDGEKENPKGVSRLYSEQAEWMKPTKSKRKRR